MIIEPIDPPSGYTPLTFRPTILKRRVLLPIIAFYLVILGLLGYLIHRSRSERVWTIRNVNYYLAARYLPAVIGVCTNALFTTTTSTLRRILPFIHLADQKNTNNKYQMQHTVCARYFPLSRRLNGIIGFLVMGNLAFHLTLAAKATLFNVEDTGRGAWLVSVRLFYAVLLGFTYLLATLITVFIAIKYAGCNTGLKDNWDPTSLADIILLFAPVNIKPNLNHPLHYNQWYRMVHAAKPRYRLGYWKITNTAKNTPPIVYGIRMTDAVVPTDSARHSQVTDDCIDAVTPTDDTRDPQGTNHCMNQQSPLSSCCDDPERSGQLPKSYVCFSIPWLYTATSIHISW